MKKLINFKDCDFVRSIQDYANKNHDGNFTLAVIDLCKKALNKEENQKAK